MTFYQAKDAPRQKMPRRHVLTGTHVGQNMPPWAKKEIIKNQPCVTAHALLSHTAAHWLRHKLLMMLATSHAYTAIGCGLYRPASLAISGCTPSQARGQAKVELLNILVIH